MDLGDDSVDVVLCRSGIMVMADPSAALLEVRRVLRPDGRLAFSVFTTAEENPWATTAVPPFVQRGHVTPPEPGGPGMFALGDEGQLRALVTDAGFALPEIAVVCYEHSFSDDAAVWSFVTDVNALLSPIVKSMEAGERDAMRRAVIDAYGPWRTADGSYHLPARVLAVLAH